MEKLLQLILIFFIGFSRILFAQTQSEIINRTASSLTALVNIQKEIKSIHPCLKEFYPVAVAYNDSLIIFDFNKESGKYKFVKITSQPFPIPEGMEASFPLSVYDNIPSCIITPKTLNTERGYATILHEFIHCCQFNSVEPALKQTLEIYLDAMKNEDYSWEIMHPFPYNDSLFINYYENFKQELIKNELDDAKKLRSKLKDYLSKKDFEYLLWEEWKEGLARFVENKIRLKMEINRNDYGKEKPYDRVAFYYSGELLISKLAETDSELPGNMQLLFEKMKNFHSGE